MSIVIFVLVKEAAIFHASIEVLCLLSVIYTCFLEQWEAIVNIFFFYVGNMRFRCEVLCLFFANMAQIVR